MEHEHNTGEEPEQRESEERSGEDKSREEPGRSSGETSVGSGGATGGGPSDVSGGGTGSTSKGAPAGDPDGLGSDTSPDSSRRDIAAGPAEDSVCEVCGGTLNLLSIRQIIGSREENITLCSSCAALFGIEQIDSSISPRGADLFAAVLDPAGVGQRDNVVCERCGTSFADLRRSGRAGGSSCYEVFQHEINSLLRGSAGRLSHRGKLPVGLQRVRNLLVEKPELEARLAQAVEREDYEEAARLRTLISELEGEGDGDA